MWGAYMANRRSAARDSQAYLFNFAAVGVGAITIFLAVFGLRTKEIAAVCSERYGTAMQFSLQRSAGEPASVSELQARLGGRDWGVIENGSVVKTADGPSALALQVNLPKTSDPKMPLGLGFTWLLAGAKTAKAGCLTYQVMLPKDFEYGEGGVLPGLFGGDTPATPQGGKDIIKSSFGTHVIWDAEGRLSLRVASAAEQDSLVFKPIGHIPAVLVSGRWVPIEQEVVLNDEGESNGVLRVWIDGTLKLEATNIMWRKTTAGLLRGADVRAHFSRGGLDVSRGPKSTNIRLSPIETRWVEQQQ
jgi:hypothetical protein